MAQDDDVDPTVEACELDMLADEDEQSTLPVPVAEEAESDHRDFAGDAAYIPPAGFRVALQPPVSLHAKKFCGTKVAYKFASGEWGLGTFKKLYSGVVDTF